MHDNRYLFFKNKLQSLWIKNNVMDAMTKETEKKKVESVVYKPKPIGILRIFIINYYDILRNQTKRKRN